MQAQVLGRRGLFPRRIIMDLIRLPQAAIGRPQARDHMLSSEIRSLGPAPHITGLIGLPILPPAVLHAMAIAEAAGLVMALVMFELTVQAAHIKLVLIV
jgi:hypothetical protein